MKYSNQLDAIRLMYVLFDLAPRIDTVAILTVDEVEGLIWRALAKEFDDDIWPSFEGETRYAR